jgi:lipopolysaccharide transport system permease protein
MAASPEILIEAGRAGRHYWRDVWAYRQLFYFLAWRDVLVRYKQTVIGIAWAFLRPALLVTAFTIVFGRLAKFPSEGVPYPLLVLAGLLPWQFFATAFADAGNSLIANAHMISKVYFPRLVVPAGAIIVSLVDFVLSLAVLAALMLWYGVVPDWRIFTLPLLMLFAMATVLGPALWISALSVEYRDFRYIVPFGIQFGLYISPVGFASGIVPEQWRLLYSLNPMVGVIDSFRWAILGAPLYLPALALSLAVTAVLLVSGFAYFRRTERVFADVI